MDYLLTKKMDGNVKVMDADRNAATPKTHWKIDLTDDIEFDGVNTSELTASERADVVLGKLTDARRGGKAGQHTMWNDVLGMDESKEIKEKVFAGAQLGVNVRDIDACDRMGTGSLWKQAGKQKDVKDRAQKAEK